MTICFVGALSFMSSAQNQNTQAQTHIYFTQCLFDIQDEQEMLQLEEQLRLIPETDMVRLDWHTQRALITTLWIDELSEDRVREWFGSYADGLSCLQVGIYGQDPVQPYPFTNCQN